MKGRDMSRPVGQTAARRGVCEAERRSGMGARRRQLACRWLLREWRSCGSICEVDRAPSASCATHTAAQRAHSSHSLWPAAIASIWRHRHAVHGSRAHAGRAELLPRAAWQSQARLLNAPKLWEDGCSARNTQTGATREHARTDGLATNEGAEEKSRCESCTGLGRVRHINSRPAANAKRRSALAAMPPLARSDARGQTHATPGAERS